MKTMAMVKASLLFVFMVLSGIGFTDKLDLSKTLVLGDSLAAGFQNGGVSQSTQVNSFVVKLAEQAGITINVPYIDANGQRLNPALNPGSPGGFNMAVPGQTLADAMFLRPSQGLANSAFCTIPGKDCLTFLFLGIPGLNFGQDLSQLEWIEAVRPTTVIVWIGSNDVLGPILANDLSLMTPVADFQQNYSAMMQRIKATGAKIVVFNVPNVLALSTTAKLIVAQMSQVDPDASNKVMQRIMEYNGIINSEAEKHDAIYYDAFSFSQSIAVLGQVVNGVRIKADALLPPYDFSTIATGGVMTLDGIHPTNTAHAILANGLIHLITKYGNVGINRVNLNNVSSTDPLFPGTKPAQDGKAVKEAVQNGIKFLKLPQ